MGYVWWELPLEPARSFALGESIPKPNRVFASPPVTAFISANAGPVIARVPCASVAQAASRAQPLWHDRAFAHSHPDQEYPVTDLALQQHIEAAAKPSTQHINRNGARRPGRSAANRPERTAAPPTADREELHPVTGILDIRNDHGFVRVSGYTPDPDDVYVSPTQIHRYGLRRGDAVTGAARIAGAADAQGRRDKRNPLVRLDTVNGSAADAAVRRPEFYEMTPLYPQDRIRLETEPHILTTRIIDLLTPIGKGQRALIVSPPKAGKTMVLQAIAHAIATNHPDCHLMALLVDERPEEVTDMQRTVRGEVIASTFDRPPADHTAVAELAIERAKRLVELGHDVVVLLDSITRLGRAYNLAAPASGRIMTGGIEASALHAPKRFLGAARKIEDGGSLTIIATALVETGSMGDTIIFEEFKSTGNAELRLLRGTADRRIFPAVDVDSSGTRKEELLLAPDELMLVRRLRKALHSLDPLQATEQLLDRLRKTTSNAEFLLHVARSATSDNGHAARR
jgi:transcription termination factor Rho